MLKWFDLHTHSPTLSSSGNAIVSVYYGQAGAIRAEQYAVGLHPWYLDHIDWDAATGWLSEQSAADACVAIGEAGLDKVCRTPWEIQMQAFETCVQLSEKTRKPLVIHCVRAFEEVVACKRRWKPAQPWVIHGFRKHPQTAQMLLKEGLYLSYGAALLEPRSSAAASLAITPPECFFLETDDSPEPIRRIYEAAAQIRGISLEALCEQIQTNWAQLH